ncbi:MAG: pentapeptide repeat-containing protein [Halobacteria archaeon]|nr:pentapeptide repeat-containing protein [Halobacteria archaeon]
MTETCDYTFDPTEWNKNHRSSTSLDSVWDCPHEKHVDTDYCIFHLTSEALGNLGITDEDLRNAFMAKVNGDDPEEKRFVGGTFGEFEIDEQDIGTPDTDTIDLRHTRFDGPFDISGSEVEADLLMGCSEFRDVEASSLRFDGDFVFRECDVDGYGNFDKTEFEGDVDFRRASFDLGAEFSEATVRGDADFRYASFKHVEAIFEEAEFEGEAMFNSLNVGEANFTSAVFGGKTDFSNGSFSDETKFQYADFLGPSKFNDAKFKSNANFRGADFEDETDFSGTRYKEWVSFRNVTYEDEACYDGAWFNSKVTFVPESENKSEITFDGAKVGSGDFEVSIYKPVFYNFGGAKVGNITLKTNGDEEGLLNYVLFRRTEFNGFDFSDYEEALASDGWEIHNTQIHPEDPDPRILEKTYELAAEGAKGSGDRRALKKFESKAKKYRRQRYKEEGNTAAVLKSYITDLI